MEPGALIDEKYEIICALGAGGFGTVYKARQAQFDRVVALKTVNTTLLQQSDGPARFEREAQAINALKHKNIVSFYGYGVWRSAPYMVVEYVEGVSLQQIMNANVPLDPKRALTIIKQVFEGLQCAHANGVVHRDLKPSNVMIIPGVAGSPEQVKIIDFGLAKLMPGYGIPGQKLTETGYALGSCHFMPPEQALGIPVDQRADIYSAGCLLYHMLTGRLPFDADNNVAIMMQQISSYPTAVSEVIHEHPLARPIAAFIDNCIAKDPKDRYQSSEEALEQIDSMMTGNPGAVQQLVAPKAMATNKAKTRSIYPLLMVTLVVTAVSLSAVTFYRGTPPERTAKDIMERTVVTFRGGVNPSSHTPNMLRIWQLNKVDHSLNREDEFRLCLSILTQYNPSLAPNLIKEVADRAIALSLNRPESEQYTLAVALEHHDLHYEATAVAERLMNSPVHGRSARFIVATNSRSLNDWGKALMIPATFADEDAPVVLNFAAIRKYLEGDLKGAAVGFTKALSADSDFFYNNDVEVALLGLARISFNEHEYKQSLAFLDDAARRRRRRGSALPTVNEHFLRVGSLISLRRESEALELLKQWRSNYKLPVALQPEKLTQLDTQIAAAAVHSSRNRELDAVLSEISIQTDAWSKQFRTSTRQ